MTFSLATVSSLFSISTLATKSYIEYPATKVIDLKVWHSSYKHSKQIFIITSFSWMLYHWVPWHHGNWVKGMTAIKMTLMLSAAVRPFLWMSNWVSCQCGNWVKGMTLYTEWLIMMLMPSAAVDSFLWKPNCVSVVIEWKVQHSA